MIITTLQRQTIDHEVAEFAQAASVGIIEVSVTITEGEGGNVFLNLFHPGDEPGKYSLLATQLTPEGTEPWTMMQDFDGTVEPF